MSTARAVQIEVIYNGVVIGARQLARVGERFVIGGPQGDAPVAALYAGEAGHVLLEVTDDAVLLALGAAMLATLDGAAIAGSMPLPASACAQIRCGEVTLVARATEPAPLLPRPAHGLRWREQRYTVASGVVLGLAVLVAAFMPPDRRALAHDEHGARLRFADFRITPLEISTPPRDRGGGGGKAGKAHAGATGATGKKTAPARPRRFAIAGLPRNRDRHFARTAAERPVADAGILGVINGQRGELLASVFGHETALGSDPETVLGNLTADPIGAAYGVGRLGGHGTGAGGGGEGQGTIGVGELNTIGSRGPGGDGAFGPRGAGRLAARRATTPDFLPGQPAVRGGLDRDIVRRIVRRHLNEVKFCYEQALAQHAELTGRVAVNFTIAATGAVAAAAIQSSTLANPRVEMCIAQAVRRWEFPRPAGGGIVIATYPFAFVSAGR